MPACNDNIKSLAALPTKWHTLWQAHTCQRLGIHGLGIIHLCAAGCTSARTKHVTMRMHASDCSAKAHCDAALQRSSPAAVTGIAASMGVHACHLRQIASGDMAVCTYTGNR